ALAVDRRPADALRPAGDERHHPPDVPALLADLGHAAELDVLHVRRVDALPRDERVQHLGRQLVAAHLGQRPVWPADRAADRVDNQRIGAPGAHEASLVFDDLALLSLEHVRRRFGGIVAVDDVSFDVEAGQVVGLIGPNGAGKTTLFNLITRLYKPDAGSIVFAGEDLLRAPAHVVLRRGIARTFQNIE